MLSRANAEALIQQQLISTIQQDVPKASVFMSLARKLPNMTSNRTRMPVLDVLPTAYWVDGDTGYKQTSSQEWDNVYIDAAELAVIVPIPEAVVDDASYDILGEVKPRIVEAMGQRVDAAVIFGLNRPSVWRADIITAARQAGNNVSVGADQDYFDAIMGENGLISKLEQYGYSMNGALSALTFKSSLRGLRTTSGTPIFVSDMQGTTKYGLDGAPMYFADNGSFDNTVARLIVGDWNRAVYAIRQDVTVKILDQGVIQNPANGAIVYNLAQQDMIALRVVFRMGWALPNPVTRLDGSRVSCPFAYLEPAAPATTQTVTFTVTDNADTPADVAGAAVVVDGVKLLTNASGEAVFHLRAGAYGYTVKKAGYTTQSGTLTVAAAAVAQAVTLPAIP